MLGSPIGRYQPGHSLMHSLDARVKGACLVVLLVLMFTVQTPAQLALAVAGLGALVALSGVRPCVVANSVRPIAPFVAIVAAFNLLMARGGDTLLSAGPLCVTTAGVWVALLYAARLLVAVALGALLLLTTTPTAITDGLESLLSPLARIGLPAHEVAMVFSLALRFVPILSDEASAVMDAQRSRGASFGEGGPLSRVRALSSVLVPVLAGAIRHANNLSRALDARCYEGGTGRTHFHEQRIRRQDVAFAAACVAWAIALACLGTLGV